MLNLYRQNLFDCLNSPPTNRYRLPWEHKTTWRVLFGGMILVAIICNCIALWIVFGHWRIRTVKIYYLLNLSAADLLNCACVFNFIFLLNSDWHFGAFYCIINNFMANLSVASSVFTLVAISLDRYIAIVKPLQYRSKNNGMLIIVGIWLLCALLAFPYMLYSKTKSYTYAEGKIKTVCYILWPDGAYPKSMADYIYNVLFFVLTFVLPMLVLVICYALMGRELCGSRLIGEQTEMQLKAIQSKRKAVWTFIIILTVFAFTWLPFRLFFIYEYQNNAKISVDNMQSIYLATYWLAMSNTIVNPIIYHRMEGRSLEFPPLRGYLLCQGSAVVAIAFETWTTCT